MPNADYTWLDGIRYELINPEIVHYPRYETRTVKGKKVRVELPELSYTVVTAKRAE